ncbi:MAG: hypothetical protein ACRDRT_01445, partial [Pseudonocardiaceae bacterium]
LRLMRERRKPTARTPLIGTWPDENAWVRMRAIDSVEKVCRSHPDWLKPFVGRLLGDLATSTQPSIQWHLAQMYVELEFDDDQVDRAISWLQARLATPDVDWIVAANAMAALAELTRRGHASPTDLLPLLQTQRRHRSSSVVKRADKLIAAFSGDQPER